MAENVQTLSQASLHAESLAVSDRLLGALKVCCRIMHAV
jgi:hypothetical protein